MQKFQSVIKENMPFQHQKKQSLIFFLIFFVVMMMCVTCAFTTTKEISIYIDSNAADSADPVRIVTVSASLMAPVSEVLEKAGVALTDDDAVNVSLDKRIKDVDLIYVTKKVEGTLYADGREIKFKSAGNTVGDVLKENGIVADSNDEVTPAKETLLTTETKEIRVVRVEVKMEGREQAVAYGTDVQLNDELSTETSNLLTAGANGIDALVENVTYKDGTEYGREVIFQARILEPVNEVIEVGTQLPGGGTLTTGNATVDPGDEMDFICAVVAQEGGHSYEGALAVISCIMNRVDNSGSDVISVITAPGQFSAYLDGAYEQYMGDELPEVRRAVTDCMVNGYRSHSFTSFRGYSWAEGEVQIGGNYYH